MSSSTAPNALDRATMAVIRSRAAMPDLCRELIKGELWFLMPRRPGEEDEVIELKPGSPLPFVSTGGCAGARGADFLFRGAAGREPEE